MQPRSSPALLRSYELQLPLGDGSSGDLARARLDHLRNVNGVTGALLARLARAFPTLRSIYAASEADLARIAGPVAAARIRWFLDAPLDTRLAGELTAAHVRPQINTNNAQTTSMPTAA